MRSLFRPISIAPCACFFSLAALLSAAPAFSQTVAYVYVQNAPTQQSANPTGNSVTLYDTASNGRLTVVGTYPLSVTSNLIGGNGSYLFAAGEDQLPGSSLQTNIDSYSVASNGALGARTQSLDTINYAGSGCSGAGIVAATLDHTGHYMFVRIIDQNSGACDQWQTYQIASNGALTYLGSEESPLIGDLQTINSNNEFAYASDSYTYSPVGSPTCGTRFFAYSRNSDNVLTVNQNFAHTDPAPAWTDWVSADPSSHLAVLMSGCSSADGTLPRIASYSINSTSGSISSTNTWSQMPTTLVDTQEPANSQSPMFMDMSTSGQLLAVLGGGFQIFHFNGASPLTPFTGLERGTDEIRQAAWDNANHFYTLDFWGGQLRVFTVTPTSFSEDPGSPVNANGGAMVVVSNKAAGSGTCSAPSSPGINVCSPANGATLTSPVQINAAATISGGIYRFELWNGSTKLLSEDSGAMDQSLSLSAGTYHLTFDARNTAGNHEYATRDITVK